MSERFAEVVAVDLHVGRRIHVELAPGRLRVHLYEGGCGNTIARLASHLQHHLDGALNFEDHGTRSPSPARVQAT